MARKTSQRTTLTVTGLVVLASVAAVARGEAWDPRKHVARYENLRAERTHKRVPRRLSARQANGTMQPGQPQHTIPDSLLGGFEIVGSSGVSAQQMFLGTDSLVYILDKVENNPLQINNHPAWGTVYDINANTATPMEVVTNTFCAGGAQLGDGQWLNLGGNQAVDPGGVTSNSQTGQNTYQDSDGGFAARTIMPGPGANWFDNQTLDMTTKRWYPTLEPLPDGRIFVLGGDHIGGFVNDVNNSNPTYEYWPAYAGESPIGSPILEDTLPANLYPIAHLLPSGQLLLNINRAAAILDLTQNQEYALPEVPYAVRTYPASASSAMLPLTVENGWNATVMYCGGSDISKDQWLDNEPLVHIPASASCIKISPATEADFEDEDSLPEGRVMGSAILLPDSTILIVNGANTGVAGYAGNDIQQGWSIDDGFSDNPTYTPILYDPTRPAGSRWYRNGLRASTIPRMYHSSATLLPDGSVLVSGSNPHPDYSPNKTYPTEYRVERFYPPAYYNKRRPEPTGIPGTISYGGSYFDIQISLDDLFDNLGNLNAIRIWLLRTGFSTHAINFGQRMVELDHTFTTNSDGSGATLHVSQAPPNAAILPPGTAWFFVVINGVPSVGVQVMVGSGALEEQTMQAPEALPESSNVTAPPSQSSNQHSDATRTQVVIAGSTIFASIFLFIAGLALLG